MTELDKLLNLMERWQGVRQELDGQWCPDRVMADLRDLQGHMWAVDIPLIRRELRKKKENYNKIVYPCGLRAEARPDSAPLPITCPRHGDACSS